MDKGDDSGYVSRSTLQEISAHVLTLEKSIGLKENKIKEHEVLKILKEKCCDDNVIVSSTAFHGIVELVQKKILSKSQTVSLFISLLPTIKHYGPLVHAVGKILIFDLQDQMLQRNVCNTEYKIKELHHPMIIILKHNKEKSWFHVYLFISILIKTNKMELKFKMKLLHPVFRYIFWSSAWKGSEFQFKLFQTLISEMNHSEILNVVLEVLMYQSLDIYYCLYLKDFFVELLKLNDNERDTIICGTSPLLAIAIEWLIIKGYDPSLWTDLLSECLSITTAPSSVILYLLTDVLMKTPSNYVNSLIDLCKSIIINLSVNKYVAYKFLSVVLNTIVALSSPSHPVQRTVNETVALLNKKDLIWNDGTATLMANKHFKIFSDSNSCLKFPAQLILTSNYWLAESLILLKWLKSLKEANHSEILLKLHSFLCGIVLKENDGSCINLCLDLLFNVAKSHGELSSSLLCLLFFKLGKETNPFMQKTYLLALPNLAHKKENIPLIVGIIESLKNGYSNITAPLVIQLYLQLWKVDSRTYPYLHKMLHDDRSEPFNWELNVSKAIAVREISRLAPHSHAKDSVGILSKILNECASHKSGLASSIAIQAITDLCKSFVIDVAGAWKAIQPQLCFDSRPQVIVSLCKFFEEIPRLKSSIDNYDHLVDNIVPMLWNYSFSKNVEITKHAFRALSKFDIENLKLKLLPQMYRKDVKLSKEVKKDFQGLEDVLSLPFVPGECWIQFLQNIEHDVLEAGGEMLMAIIERELQSFPRPIFFLPPEKPEPLTYSYLPQRSICRAAVDFLIKQASRRSPNLPRYLKELIRVLGYEYSKILPPLNWSFMEYFLGLDSDFRFFSIALMSKQGALSESAKMILCNSLETIKWDLLEWEEISRIYSTLPLVCKALSYNSLEKFLENTIKLGVENELKQNRGYFKEMLWKLRETLKNSSVASGHRALVAKHMEKVLLKIPPDHEVMDSFAVCATEFPVQIIENITSIKPSEETNPDMLRRAILIRQAIALREDIKTPLIWLNEAVEIGAELPSEQNFILSIICSVIRRRRDCNHFVWAKELSWKIQECIRSSKCDKSNAAALFLIDVFLNGIFILSGYECLFNETTESAVKSSKILQNFPQSLSFLLSDPDWLDFQPKLSKWFQYILRWKGLPMEYTKIFTACLLHYKKENVVLDEDSIPSFSPLYFE